MVETRHTIHLLLGPHSSFQNIHYVVNQELSDPLYTTLDLDITAGLITVGFVITGSDLPSLPVMSLKMKNDWGWAKTGSEGPHHCRFVA